MDHLFSPGGEAAIRAAMSLRPLLAFDFDGTLAPIVMRPNDAWISATVAQRLDRLSRLLPVAVITGRRVDDVAPRLGFQPRFIIGNHGAEDHAGTPRTQDKSASLEALRKRLRLRAAMLSSAGVDIEDKHYSIAFHYRLAPNRQDAIDAITATLGGQRDQLKVFGGKLVVNAMAGGAPDKADAVIGLVQRCGSMGAIFVGDDVNDEAVFARAASNWLTVRVGRDEPNSKAKFFLDSVTEVGMMLTRMLECGDTAA